MSRRLLRRLSARQAVTAFLASKRITTVEDVLMLNLLELLELGISHDDAVQLIDLCTKAAAPQPTTAATMLRSGKRFLSTTLQALDRNLAGGLPVGSITEVAGPSGCGKTQFCMMMSAVASVCERDTQGFGGVLYLDTEGSFNGERLVQMARAKFPRDLEKAETLIAMSESIHWITTKSSTDLLHTLERLDERIVQTRARLVVLDSAASLLRKEYRGHDAERGDLLAREATLLKRWAEVYSIPVLVTNQVTTRFDDQQGGDAFVTAALGNTWAHSVNTRLTVSYSPDDAVRYLSVIKSPLVPASSIAYRITQEGLIQDEAVVPQALAQAQTATAVRIHARNRFRQGASRDTSAEVHRGVLAAQRDW